jgi:hypothetical protein
MAASMIATFDISRAIGPDGKEIDPEPGASVGMIQ